MGARAANSEETGTGLVGRPLGPAAKALFAFAKLSLFCVVIIFIGRALAARWAAISWAEMRFRPGFLVLAAACQAARLLLIGCSYRFLLAPQCRLPRRSATFAIVWIGRLGKYVPGKLASALGTVWMLRREGVPVRAAGSAVFLCQGLMVTIGLLVASPLTLWQPVYQRLPMAWLGCVLVLSAGLVFLHPRGFFAVSDFVLGKLRLPPLRTQRRYRNYLGCLGTLVVNVALGGIGLWFVARSVTDVPIKWVPVLTSAGALAGAVGFLAVFAPGGLGVREGILLIILGRIIAPGDSAVVVVGARLMEVVVEIAMAGVGLLILRFLPKRSATVDKPD